MKVFKLLSADLFVQPNVGTEEQQKNILDFAYSQKRQNPTEMAFSNYGCWRSEFKYEDIDWLIQNILDVVHEAIKLYEGLDLTYKNKVKHYGLPRINYWTNINEPGAKNVMHCHDLHHYVAVYYIQSKNTGAINFHNPANLLENCHAHSPFVSQMSYEPSDGDLLIWPGWMPHSIDENRSKIDRVNIAFNIRFETPRMIENRYD